MRGCALYYDTNKAKSRETKWSGMRGFGFRVSGSGFRVFCQSFNEGRSLLFTCPTKCRCCLSVRSWSVGEPARRSLLFSVGEVAGYLDARIFELTYNVIFRQKTDTVYRDLIICWICLLYVIPLTYKNLIFFIQP